MWEINALKARKKYLALPTTPSGKISPTMATKLQEELIRRMEAQGLSGRALCEKAGVSASVVKTILSGQSRNPRTDTIAKLANALSCTSAELMGEASPGETSINNQAPPMNKTAQRPGENPQPQDVAFKLPSPPLGGQTLPIVGRHQPGPRGGLVIEKDMRPVGWTERPDLLRGAEAAYATYVWGEEMRPRYYPGNLLWVDPGQPLLPDKGVLVILHTGEAFPREFIRRDEECLIVREYWPKPKEVPIPWGDIRSADRIIGVTDR